MKIQLLLPLMTLGFALGEPIPKQALSQRQTDDSISSGVCALFDAQIAELQKARKELLDILGPPELDSFGKRDDVNPALDGSSVDTPSNDTPVDSSLPGAPSLVTPEDLQKELLAIVDQMANLGCKVPDTVL
ncbi:hypothetical protein BDV39DRAFT_210022 [Aspergillus sergii]|uniref:Uncharacterized protein n=1 Tax=Aspergillus sergii TaxID=1034303 RepID=A0A5N6WMT1_9EURO|nr:hypothetical protein BDV39DRAFT_210022 [Aspergillus sergii]